jgi:hypothetical protein
MRSNVWIRKADSETKADLVDAYLDPGDSSLTRIHAVGNVHSLSRDPKSMMEVDAQTVDYVFSKGGRWISKITAEGDVRPVSMRDKRDISAKWRLP